MGDLYKNKNRELNNENSANAHLHQLKLSMIHLHKNSHVIIDNTSLRKITWFGKGAVCVPYLLENEFKISFKNEDGIAFSKDN